MDKANEPDILLVEDMPSELQLYLPIVRVNKEKREVIVRATSEALDSYKTVFDFEASQDAFTRWKGNIREMHDPTKAVGRAVNWEPVPEDKAIDVTLRVSKGAADTWEKVLDGTLAGASVGARNGVWEKRMINGEEVPVLVRYDLVEVSLVDNPANPDCMIQIIRADGVATETLDDEEDEPVVQEETPEDVPEVERNETPDDTRAGARVSHATQEDLHSLRNSQLSSAKKTMQICGCDECLSGISALDPDNDGDIDILPSMDYDGDGGASGDGSGNGGYALDMAIKAELTRQLTPIITRFNAIGGRLSQVNITPVSQEVDSTDTTRRLEAMENKLNGLDGIHSLLSEVRGVVERIAALPQPGGPVVNSSVMRNAQQVDKTVDDAEVIERLSRAGILNRTQQVNAALYLQKQGLIGQ